MKRFINGREMLQSLEMNHISSLEKMIYLFIVIGPKIPFFNMSMNSDSFKASHYFNFYIFIMSITFFWIISKKEKIEKDIIEKYIATSVSAIVTCYLILIPLSLLVDVMLKKHFSPAKLEEAFDYFLTLYLTFYPVCSLYLWNKKRYKN